MRYYLRTRFVALLCVGVLSGLVLAKLGLSLPIAYSFIAGLIGLGLIARGLPLFLLGALMIGVLVGMSRGELFMSDQAVYDKKIKQEVGVVGKVLDDTAYSKYGQSEFHIGSIVMDGQELKGRLRVRGFGLSGIGRGDLVRVNAKLYPAFGNRQGSLSFAEVEVIESKASILEKVRSKYFAGVYTAIPEPESSLGLGFLVGLRTMLPEELLDQLSATGLTHIVAVSGYNLTILVRLSRRFFAKYSKRLATATSVSMILGFLAVTGVSPSIARASVVSLLAIGAWYFGREVKPSILLLISAAITAYVNPFYLWLDLGWWLSFLAFIGVLILAPLLTHRLYRGKKPGIIGQIVLETTCAQLLALPLIVVVFGELSLISILANALILPLIPLAMLLTFIAGIGGGWLPLISGWISWPATILLSFMTGLIAILAHVSWAIIEIDANWAQMGVFYLCLTGFIWVLWRRNPRINGTVVIE